ncbi:uncharacterized protein LOC111193257, partial [Tachysurus ichikawai]
MASSLPNPVHKTRHLLAKMTTKDDVEAFLETFQHTADRDGWSKHDWVDLPAPLLTREAPSTPVAKSRLAGACPNDGCCHEDKVPAKTQSQSVGGQRRSFICYQPTQEGSFEKEQKKGDHIKHCWSQEL